MYSFLENSNIVTNDGTSNTGMTLYISKERIRITYLNVQEIAEGNDDFLDLLRKFSRGSKNQSLTLLKSVIDVLKNADRESSCFPSSRLCLSNDIVTLENRHDGSLLNSGRSFKTCGNVSTG